MTKTKVALIIAFVAVFAAGAVVGRVGLGTPTKARVAAPSSDPAAQPAPPKHGRDGEKGGGRGERSFWVKELNLSEQQADEMRGIWESTMADAGKQFHEQRQLVDKDFDEKLRTLVGDANFTAYSALREERQRQMEELGKDRGKAFEAAVRLTKDKVLSPEQATKYDALMAKRREFGGGGDRGGRDGRRGGAGGTGFGAPPPPGEGRGPRGADRPSTRPATAPIGQ